MASLSVAAKEFIPNPLSNTHNELKSFLSVDVPEFVPKSENSTQNASIKKKSNLKAGPSKTKNSPSNLNEKEEKKTPINSQSKQKLSKRDSKENFNPRHDTDWAKEEITFPAQSLSPRHDPEWFHRDTINIKEPTDSFKKQILRKSDSYHISLSQKSISLRTKAERKKLVQTFSLEYSKQEKKFLQEKNSYQLTDVGVPTQERTPQPRVSWSAIVKTPAAKEKLVLKTSDSPRQSQTINPNTKQIVSPNTGHSRDLRTKSYDVERDKRMKLNKLKKTTSVLGSFDQPSASKTILSKRLSHQILSESKSVGAYEFMLGAKPKTNIQRKSLVLQAKLSAGLRQDPKMDNWFDKEVPETIDRLTALPKDNDDINRKILDENKTAATAEANDNLVKRKLTRTTKKVFSPTLKVEIMSSRSLNDDYFMSEKYNADLHKRDDGEQFDDKEEKKKVTLEKSDLHKVSNDSTTVKTKMAEGKTYAWNLEKPAVVEFPSQPQPSQPQPSTTGILSYSAMLKKASPGLLVYRNRLNFFQPQMESSAKNAEKRILTAEEIRLYKKTRKKEKKKIKKQRRREEVPQTQGSTTEKKTTTSKLSQKGISLDISEMFDKLLVTSSSKQGKKNKQKKIVISTGVVSVVSGLAKKNTTDGKKTARNKYGGTGIIMDGATPIVKRGKERQTPKKKKPTLLKKIIKAERERKHQLLEKQQTTDLKQASCDQDTEIKQEEGSVAVQKSTVSEVSPDNNAEVLERENTENNRRTVLTDLPEEICKQIHSRKFREYCDHVLMKEINNLTHELLITLQKYQDRVYHENPMKFKQKRRFVLGLREVLKHAKLKKLKAIIIAPNLERISSEGGLDDYLRNIITLCEELEIPKIFAMNRHALGKTLKKKAPVSVIGIFNYDGVQDTFKELLNHVEAARKAYKDKVQNIILNQTQENGSTHPQQQQQQQQQQKRLQSQKRQQQQQQQQQQQTFVNNTSEGGTLIIENFMRHPPPLLEHSIEAEQLKQRMLSNFSEEEFILCEEESRDLKSVKSQSWDIM